MRNLGLGRSGIGAFMLPAFALAVGLAFVLLCVCGPPRASAAPGDLDLGWAGPAFSGDMHTVVALPDGTSLVGGAHGNIGGSATYQWSAHLDTDGSHLTATSPLLEFTPNEFTRQADGKILVAGVFTSVAGQPRSRAARLHANGALDLGFTPPAFNSTNYAVAEDPDGKVIVGGNFSEIGLVLQSRIARLHSNGALDASFNPPLINNVIREVARQDDGKYLIGGSFTEVDGEDRGRIARLNADGSHDDGFEPPFLSSDVWRVIALPGGKALVAGVFQSAGGDTTRSTLIRLNPDGSLDTTFTSPAGVAGLWDVALRSDGSMYIGGWISNVNGETRSNVALLGPDGELDPGFVTETFLPSNGIIESLDVMPNGDVLVGGRFTSIGGVNRSKVALLEGKPAPLPPPAGGTAALAFFGKARTKPKRVRPGKTVRVRVRVRNTGSAPATRVEVCPRLKKKLRRSFKPRGKRGGCRAVGNLAAGQRSKQVQLRFKTNLNRVKPGKRYRLRVESSGRAANGAALRKRVVQVKVRVR